MSSPRTDEFADRHIGPRAHDVAEMLAALDVASLDELIDRVVPAAIRSDADLDLPTGVSEADALARLRELADRNRIMTSLIGMGYSGTITPTVILRNVLESPAWYTAYTPYQPEISQGRLEALLNFQTMVCDLTGMELANASLLDESTAAAEAMAMCRRLTPKAGPVFVVDADCHPQTIEVVRTRARPLGIEIEVRAGADLAAVTSAADLPAGTFGVLVQYPGSTGAVRDHATLVEAAHEAGALVTVAADLLAMVLLRPPGEIGADIVVGSSQRFGVPLGFGGPHAAFIATRDAHKRTLPGRLVGVSVDAAGRTAYRLTLQTREQHIRREKATSNICTAQVLLAVMAGLYATYHGPEGLTAIATQVHEVTQLFAAGVRAGGLELVHDDFFDTVAVRVPGRADEVVAAACADGVNLRRIDADTIGASFDETTPESGGGSGVAGARHRPRAHLLAAHLDHPVVPRAAAAHHADADPSRVPRAPLRDRDAALPAAALRSRPGPRPHDDPARVVHHEAQRHDGDDPGDVAGLRVDPPLRPLRPGGRVPRAHRRPRVGAGRDHRLRRGVAPTQRRLPGRAGRTAGDPGVPRRAAATSTATCA